MLANKTITANATCNVTSTGEDGKQQSVAVMTMSGNLTADGKYSINRRVNYPEAYNANKEEMDQDAADFEAMLLSALK